MRNEMKGETKIEGKGRFRNKGDVEVQNGRRRMLLGKFAVVIPVKFHTE